MLALKAFLVFALFLVSRLVKLRWKARRLPQVLLQQDGATLSTLKVGIFHPYADAGGGGERVLWWSIVALLELSPAIEIVVYTWALDGVEAEQIVENASRRFGLGEIDRSRIRLEMLKWERFLRAEWYPRLTMIGQSLGSMLVGIEAMGKHVPHVYLDTMGYAFTYPIAWFCGCRVACYTHYPTISSDMIARVVERRPSYNNNQVVAGSHLQSRLKLLYYKLFSWLYALMGNFAEVVMVNSNWTRAHIEKLWGVRTSVVFPPCDTFQFSKASSKNKRRIIVSVGQFRPEKDHKLQIEALSCLKMMLKPERNCPKLYLFGSCRDEGDAKRVEDLKSFAKAKSVEDLVDFRINVPFDQLKDELGSSLIGIHTMWNEHFGIALVELMAAGAILVAHNSGGPKLDIVEHGRTGFLSTSAQEFAEQLLHVLDMFDHDPKSSELEKIRSEALESIKRFEQDRFVHAFKVSIRPALTN